MWKQALAHIAGFMATAGNAVAETTPIARTPSSGKVTSRFADRSLPRGNPGDKLRRKAAKGKLGLSVLR